MSEARKRAGAPASRTRFQEIKTIEDLPFAVNSFDGVICLSVLEYLEHPNVALIELLRVIKPGGTLYSPFRTSDPSSGSCKQSVGVSVRIGASKRPVISPCRDSRRCRGRWAGVLEAQNVAVRAVRCFDAVLPRDLHWLLKPALFYMVCQKDTGNTAQ